MRTGEADSITLLPQLPNIANVARRGTTQPCLRDHPQNCGAHDQAEHSPHGANSTVPANFPSAHFWLHLTRPCGEGVQQAQAPRGPRSGNQDGGRRNGGRMVRLHKRLGVFQVDR